MSWLCTVEDRLGQVLTENLISPIMSYSIEISGNVGQRSSVVMRYEKWLG